LNERDAHLGITLSNKFVKSSNNIDTLEQCRHLPTDLTAPVTGSVCLCQCACVSQWIGCYWAVCVSRWWERTKALYCGVLQEVGRGFLVGSQAEVSEIVLLTALLYCILLAQLHIMFLLSCKHSDSF